MEGTKLTLQIGDTVLTWESPYDDLSTDELTNAFFGLMVGQTFMPVSILTAMQQMAESHLNLYGYSKPRVEYVETFETIDVEHTELD